MTVSAEIAQVIVDPKAYADGRSQAAFTRLRKEAPLARIEAEGYPPFWAVTRHADIMDVERRAEDFSSGDLPVTLIKTEAFAYAQANEASARSLVQLDGGEHRALRTLTQSWFMPQNLRKLEVRIREIARRSIDHMASLGGACDFSRDVAMLYPLRVIMEILGVPEADEGLMLKLTQEMFGVDDEDLGRTGVGAASGQEAMRLVVADLARYFSVIIEDRRRAPKGDLASVIANGVIDGAPIGYAEAIGYFVITATAGHDTTSNTTATAVWKLAEQPELLRALKADPSLIAAHVEESVRWASSVRHFMRGATRDCEVAGKKIRKGDWLMLCYSSGNRDEEIFENPFEYDIRRSPNRHIAFGYGPHVCIGQHLGRMEMRILLEELLPRLETLELAGDPVLSNATFVGGPKRVPIRYTMN